jgi:hypothetical protein
VWTPSGFLYPWGAAVPEPETQPLTARGLQRQQHQLPVPVPVRRLSQLDKLQALFSFFPVKQNRGVYTIFDEIIFKKRQVLFISLK